MHRIFAFTLVGLSVAFMASFAHASINPFTETFSSGASNWFNPLGTAPVTWQATGGPDGSPFVTTSFNFQNLTPGLPFPNNAVNLFRAQDEFNSSNHAFEGNWIADGVTTFSFDIRHDAQAAMTFFVRFATPSNFPAWSGVEFTAAAGNQWTHIAIPISLSNPALFFEGPPGGQAEFNSVFSNVGHVQIGVFAGGLAGVNQDVTFDLDNVSIVPTPSAIVVLLSGLCCAGRRRRSQAQRRAERVSSGSRGFTIVELLAVVAIVGLLIGVLAPALSSVRNNAHMTIEKSAARQLMVAFSAYAAANNDSVLPGYADRIPADPANPTSGIALHAYDARGREIDGQGPPPLSIARQRYLWRLAPYLQYNLRGLYVNQQQELLENLESNDYNTYLYTASISPSLGMNSMWIGGDSKYAGFLPTSSPLRAVLDLDHYYVRTLSSGLHTDQLMVFCSARGVDPQSGNPSGGQPVEGYFRVTSPYYHELVGYQWSETFDAASDPASYGYISPRYRGRAVAGFFDGHTDTISADDLKDMRHWANWATKADWRLPRRSG
jgi:prepilin-type N-terminal cleavage/methylation domain-containing protein